MSRPAPRQLVSPLPYSPAGSSLPQQGAYGQGNSLSNSASRSQYTNPPQQQYRPNYQPNTINARPMSSSTANSVETDLRMSAESVARTHWETFNKFLGHGVESAHPRQNKAREKLTRLSRTQFQELSTDVYDEVQRRQSATSRQASLPSNASFHPKRNQAREKLASLQTPRFKDLASDVFYEIERRFPEVDKPVNDPRRRRPSGVSDSTRSSSVVARPAQSSNVFRQTAVLPNKSVMLEEGDSDYEEGAVRSPGHEDAFSLKSSDYAPQSRTGSISVPMVFSKSSTSDRGAPNGEQERLINDLRSRIRDLELGNKAELDSQTRGLQQSLQDEQEKVNDLELQVQELKSRANTDAAEENVKLKRELAEQQQITEEVRAEAESFLNEMRELSDKESTVLRQTEALQTKVDELQAEVQMWKQKYQDTKIQLRQLKTSSQFFSPMPNLKESDNNAYIHPSGIIRDVVISKFQLAVDDLLRVARSNPANMLEPMKDILLATRSVQKDLDESSAAIAQDARVLKLKQRMTNTANNLTTASKNHINGGALSPVSLVDAAASHLTSTVIELAKLCKLKATENVNGDFDFRDTSNDHASTNSSVHSDSRFPFTPIDYGEAPRSFLSDSGSKNDRRQGSSYDTPHTFNIDEQLQVNSPGQDVRHFLEAQTGAIVNSIQKLLSAIRIDAKPAVLQTYMKDIVVIVSKVTASMRQAFANSLTLRAQSNHIVTALEQCTSRLRDMDTSGRTTNSDQASKEFKQELAGIAFDTAKQTKELSIVLQKEEGHMSVDLT